jgi:hypothetical protein
MVRFTQRCAATRGIAQHRIDRRVRGEGRHVFPRERSRRIQITGMSEQRAATTLALGYHDIISIARQDPDGGTIDGSKDLRHQATFVKGDASATHPFRGRESGQGSAIGAGREGRK